MSLFVAFAEAVAPLRSITEEIPRPNAFSHLQKLDQKKGCDISNAADLCLMLTDGLNESRGVYKMTGELTEATLSKVTT